MVLTYLHDGKRDKQCFTDFNPNITPEVKQRKDYHLPFTNREGNSDAHKTVTWQRCLGQEASLPTSKNWLPPNTTISFNRVLKPLYGQKTKHCTPSKTV